MQLLPPPEGAGLLHKRCLVLVPPPHVAEHDDQLIHEPHPPFTVIANILMDAKLPNIISKF